MPGLDLLTENELDLGRIFFFRKREDGGIEGFEHFGGVLGVIVLDLEHGRDLDAGGLQDRHSQGL